MTDSINEASQPGSLYSGYEEWKGWTEDGILPEIPHPTNQDYFTRELERAKIPPRSKILEIGFGNGEFLQWAELSGYHVSGIEINEKLYQMGKERGFRVFLGTVADDLEKLESDFDAVVAFDVLEHLPKEVLTDYFECVSEKYR